MNAKRFNVLQFYRAKISLASVWNTRQTAGNSLGISIAELHRLLKHF